ncbi:MAG TPA: ribonuclease H-like domain-containing protein, partial [Nitrososphaera sp.]
HDVHSKPVIVGEYAIVGIEGAIYDPNEPENGIGFTLHSESEVAMYLDDIKNEIGSDKKLIIISHTPPRGVLDLAIRFGQRNIGSKALRKYIEKNSSRVPLVVCGHVHLQGGKDKICKQTRIVNAASHDFEGAPGKLALIELDSQGVAKVQWRRVEKGLGLYGVGSVKAERFFAAGITKVHQIIEHTPEALAAALGCSLDTAHKYRIRARSVVENRIIATRPIVALDNNPIFLDIETDLVQSVVWLVGVYFEKEARFVRYFAERPSDEKCVLRKFVDDMADMNGTIYTFSGTRFDERVLKKRLETYGFDHSRLPPFFDICTEIRRAVIFPIQSYRLKDLARYFGYRYRHPNLDGMTVAMEYMTNYQHKRDKKLLRQLFEYNEDDVKSLPAIVAKVAEVAGTEIRVTETTERVIDVRVEIPRDSREQLALLRKYYKQCGVFRERVRGNELRFKTKNPIALAEIKAAMSALGFRDGTYQEIDGKSYLPYYGKNLSSLVTRLNSLSATVGR